jgi:ATP-binding cassette subfamily B protein
MDSNKYTLKLYWQQIRKNKASFFVALIAIPVAALSLDTFFPFFLSQSIGGLSSQQGDSVTHNLLIAGCFIAIGVSLNLLGFQSLLRHEANVRFNLARDTFDKLMSKDLSFFTNEKIGALTGRYIDFLRSHVTLQDLLIIRTLGFVASVIMGLVIVGTQSLLLAVILFFLLLAIALQVRYSLKYRKPYRHARKELIGDSNGKVADALTNSLIVKTFANESSEIKHLDSINNSYRKAFIKDLGLMSMEGSMRLLFMSIIQIVAVSICAYLVSHDQMSIPIAIFLLVYLQRISTQLFTLGEIINGYDQALLEASPMSDMLAKPTNVTDKPNASELDTKNPTINISSVSYHYEDNSEDVLRDINLEIKAGEKVGLVGHSGTGKTTITHLLLRFADVTAGSITIEGKDIRDITQASLRRNIAYVPQEPMLFHRSLRDNITYGNVHASDTEIHKAIKQANAEEFIGQLPKGIDTIVGERGIKLSGGQRQRIAIARALLKNAPILVLDEATSALDSASEKLIQQSLIELMDRRTSIVIAHRLSTIAQMDRIVVLDKGKIVEQGTHQELLDKKGIYANLWSHQSGGFIKQ